MSRHLHRREKGLNFLLCYLKYDLCFYAAIVNVGGKEAYKQRLQIRQDKPSETNNRFYLQSLLCISSDLLYQSKLLSLQRKEVITPICLQT